MSLRVWFPFIKDTAQQGLSSTSVTAIGSGTTLNDYGKLGKCYYFDGTTNGYMTTDFSTNIGTSDFSIALWVKIPTITSGSYFTICSSKGQSGASAGLGIYWNYSQKKFLWSTSDGTATEIWQADTVDTIVYDKWIHLVMVRESADAKHGYFYINGIRYELASVPAIRNITASTATLHLGKISNGAYPLKMYLNDFRFYDHALSPKEVSEIAKGLVCHYQLNNDARGGLPNLLKYSKVNSVNQSLLSAYSSAWTSRMTIVNIDSYACYHYPSAQNSTWFSSGYWYSGLAANTTYTYSAYIYFTATVNFSFTSLGHFQVYNASSTASDKSHEDVVSARIYEPSTIKANTWTKIRITFTTNSLDGSKFCIYPRYNLAANTGDLYFRDCKLELGDKPTAWTPNASDNEYTQLGYNENIIYDSSGFSNNSKAVNNIFLSPDTPRNTISTQFVDNTSTVTITSCFSVGQTLTELSVSIWYRTNTLNSTAPNLWSLGENSFVRIRLANATSLWYYIRVGSTQVGATFAAGKTLTDNTWHHVVLTFKNGVVTMYLDSIQIGKTDHSATATYVTCNSAGNTWHLAGYTATVEKFIGSLSDFRLYTTCLSSDAVKQLYNTPVSIANNGSMLTQGEFVEL